MWSYDTETDVITMTKGDTPSFKVKCYVTNDEGEKEEYEPEDGDEFYFAVKAGKRDRNYLFKRRVPNDTMTLTLEESDTKELELGKYIWEISLNKPSDGYHCTFIANKVLILTVEVY